MIQGPQGATVQTGLSQLHCEFCRELRGDEEAFFHQVYARPRVFPLRAGLAVMPTLGQLLSHGLLVIPTCHVDRFADLPIGEQYSASEAVRSASRAVTGERALYFEHGATRESSAGCGIYHAHIHVVPIDRDVRWHDLLPSALAVDDLPSAWQRGAANVEYLAIVDTYGDTAVRTVGTEERGLFPSQYFRRRLVEHLDLQLPWDWRLFPQPESQVIDCINLLGRWQCADVS